jgi:hypothetical protein
MGRQLALARPASFGRPPRVEDLPNAREPEGPSAPVSDTYPCKLGDELTHRHPSRIHVPDDCHDALLVPVNHEVCAVGSATIAERGGSEQRTMLVTMHHFLLITHT